MMLEVDPARILRRKMHLDTQDRMDLVERALVCRGERIASTLGCIQTRIEESTREDTADSEHADASRLVHSAAHIHTQPHPDCRQPQAGQCQYKRDEHGV